MTNIKPVVKLVEHTYPSGKGVYYIATVRLPNRRAIVFGVGSGDTVEQAISDGNKRLAARIRQRIRKGLPV